MVQPNLPGTTDADSPSLNSVNKLNRLVLCSDERPTHLREYALYQRQRPAVKQWLEHSSRQQ